MIRYIQDLTVFNQGRALFTLNTPEGGTMHPNNIEYCKMNAAFAIYQHCSRGNDKQDWADAERLLNKYPFTAIPHQEEMPYEKFQQEYGHAVYYHVMNHILFLHSLRS